MAQTPVLEGLEQRSKFQAGRPHFLLVINESALSIMGDRVLGFLHVRQHRKEAVALGARDFPERPSVGGGKQGDERTDCCSIC